MIANLVWLHKCKEKNPLWFIVPLGMRSDIGSNLVENGKELASNVLIIRFGGPFRDCNLGVDKRKEAKKCREKRSH